jgi:hypothetical protein
MRTPGSPFSSPGPQSPYMFNGGTLTPGSMHSLAFEGAMESTLANSPVTPTREALLSLYRPRSLAEKARINGGCVSFLSSVCPIQCAKSVIRGPGVSQLNTVSRSRASTCYTRILCPGSSQCEIG